jgi:hypothetical protein
LLEVAQSFEITTVNTPVRWEEDGQQKSDNVGVVKFVKWSDTTAEGATQEREEKDKSAKTSIRKGILNTLKDGAKTPGEVKTACQDLGSVRGIERAFSKLEEEGRVKKTGSGPSNTKWMLATAEEKESMSFDKNQERGVAV